ncbi:hypothetical protein FQR65_LT14343 [Abscondita terminalis]|nr:hypothetical protein FQR65_LT14343 [Abscondita terminalis]
MEEQYVIHGPKPATYLEGKTLGHVFYNILLKYIHLPDAVINVHTKVQLSYKDVLVDSCRLAQSMQRWGLSPKDVVGICCENCEQYSLAVLAGLYTGITVATLNNNYTESTCPNTFSLINLCDFSGELSGLIELTQPSIIFCSEKTLNKILSLKNKFDSIKKVILLNSLNDIEDVECLRNFIKKNSDEDFNVKEFQPTSFSADENIALIMCSSGTTGFPKAVALSHTNVRIRLIHSQDPQFTEIKPFCSRFLVLMPMSHGLGQSMILSYFLSGYSVVVMEKFEPEMFLNVMQTYKIAGSLLVPSLFTFLVKNPLTLRYDLSSLEFLASGGAPLKKELRDATQKKYPHVKIMEGYGLTETFSAVILTQPKNSKVGSIGKIGPLVSTKIVDIDTGKALGPNEVGEFCFRGPVVMKYYVNNEKATNEVIDKYGWFHTGDVGYYDEDYDFYIVDRMKDLIKYKGFQVSPSELEQIILEHPKVQDVGIVSVSDDDAGEVPAACVVVRPGQDVSEKEIKDFVIGKVSYPKYLRGGVYFVDVIPKNSSGKIDRRELKKTFEEMSMFSKK